MSDTVTIYKEDGRWHADAFRAILDTLPNGQYEVSVKQAGKKSSAQNKGLHTLFTIIAKMLNAEGYGDGRQWTKERVKAHCKRAELYPVEDMVLPGGEVVQVTVDTRDLTMLEASQTIERIYAYFLDLGLELPELNKQIKMDSAA